MVAWHWTALGLATVLVACADSAHSGVSGDTTTGAEHDTSTAGGDGDSSSGIVEVAPPAPCGEVVTNDCQLANAIAIATAGEFVLGGWDLGPQLGVVDTVGDTLWDSHLGQRGSFDAVALLPDGRIVGVGSTGDLSSGEVSGVVRVYDADGQGGWGHTAELGSSFGPAVWWDAAQRLAVAATRTDAVELWFFDTDGMLRFALDHGGARVDALAPLGDGLVTCAGETLAYYDTELARVGEHTFVGLSCMSIASDGRRLALIANEELVVLDDARVEQWRASVATSAHSVAFHGGNIVTVSPGSDSGPMTLQWFSTSGESLWTIEHPVPPSVVWGSPLAVHGNELWVASTELDADCMRTRLACFAHAR